MPTKKRRKHISLKKTSSKKRKSKVSTLDLSNVDSRIGRAVDSSLTRVTDSRGQSEIKIPIWQRKFPSVIDEIQLTVKRQATRNQYRDFVRALKNINQKETNVTSLARKDHVPANDSTVNGRHNLQRKGNIEFPHKHFTY